MTRQAHFVLPWIALLASFSLISCSTGLLEITKSEPVVAVSQEPKKSELVELSVAVQSNHRETLPEGSRVVVLGITGPCADDVRDTLTRRLIDNNQYDILSRDYLKQILDESDLSWGAGFNSKTAAKLGRLMGASLFLVGHVMYCGPADGDSVYTMQSPYSPYDRWGTSVNIVAAVQIIDINTGKVILSTTGEGRFDRRDKPGRMTAEALASLRTGEGIEDGSNPASAGQTASNLYGLTEEAEERSSDDRGRNAWWRLRNGLLNKIDNVDLGGSNAGVSASAGDEEEEKERIVDYPTLRAADDLANRFADRFFSRPAWETVEMWANRRWTYGSDATRLVKLGQCDEAVRRLTSEQSQAELKDQSEPEVGEYLHNLGVALLCNNELKEASDRLRSAYRVGYQTSTLRMLGLIGKLQEWRLEVELDDAPEMVTLGRRPFEQLASPDQAEPAAASVETTTTGDE